VSTICVQGRHLTEADIDGIRALRLEHPQWSRQRLSEHLAQGWQWHNEAGRLKDMAVRTLLLKLEARGLIDLPAPLTRNGNRQRRAQPPALLQPELLHSQPDRILTPLAALQPVGLERIQTAAQRQRLTQILQLHHYRGYSGAVGENVQYVAKDRRGRELAVMVFGAAAWKVAARDQFIGWSMAQRQVRLPWVVNQQRFLILPWIRVSHLASHLLALALGRLSADWQHRYGHPVWLVETFVQAERFAATSYQAAGWIRVGETTGRTRQDRQHTLQTPIKSVWVKPLHSDFRKHLALP
jgi:hypothetical protein